MPLFAPECMEWRVCPPGSILVVAGALVGGVAERSSMADPKETAKLWQLNLVPSTRAMLGSGRPLFLYPLSSPSSPPDSSPRAF